MKRILIASMLVFTACDRSAQQTEQTAADSAGLDTAAAAAPASSTPMMNVGARFDPQATKAGDRVAGLQVVKQDLKPAADTASKAWAGSVAFKGELQLSGGYRAHFEYPEVNEACFWVDPAEWPKVPRAQGDTRIIWFCFTNRNDAIKQLGALGTDTRATIVIDDYTTNIERADVWDSARLVRVVTKNR